MVDHVLEEPHLDGPEVRVVVVRPGGPRCNGRDGDDQDDDAEADERPPHDTIGLGIGHRLVGIVSGFHALVHRTDAICGRV